MSNTKKIVGEFVEYLKKATADVPTPNELANLGQLFLVELVAICLPGKSYENCTTAFPYEVSKDDNLTKFKDSLIGSVD
jgi:hypothetical protein